MKRLISQYFHFERGKVRPKYEKVQSQLNQREMLYEQVLVRLNENGGMTSASILDEFKNTYWWYLIQKEAPEKSIDQLIEIGAVSIQKALRDLTNEKTRMQSAHIADDQVKITKAENKVLQGIITDTISQTCALYRDYPSCTCREFKFSEETNEIILCRHLIKLIEVGLKKYPRLTNDLACLALQREYILDSLLKMDMVKAVGDDYYITELGKLTAELLIKPSTAIVIKARLSTIETLSDLLETIQKLHVVELERYLDDMFVQIMLELINRPDGTDLAFKMLEASEKYLRGVGDIEEYVQFARRMARTIAKFSQLYDFKNGLTHSLHIEKKLYE
jgi:superfamily II helicase